MTEYREYHDPVFTRDEAGNPIVTRYPFAGEYAVTNRTGQWEQQIAEKSGLRLVRLNADGRVVEPMADYLKADTSV